MRDSYNQLIATMEKAISKMRFDRDSWRKVATELAGAARHEGQCFRVNEYGQSPCTCGLSATLNTYTELTQQTK
jgi:hypothetical protein